MANQVEANDRRVRYEVTNPAGQSGFQIDFPVDKDTWLKVYKDGDVQVSGYSVDLSALEINFSAPQPQGTIITIEGLQILERENGYPLSGDLSSRLLNADMNFIIRALQEMRRDLDRAVLLNKAEPNATSNVMPKFIEGRAIVCGPDGIALSTANFVDLDANLVLVQEAAEAVFTIKDDAQGSAEDAEDAAALAVAAAAGVDLPVLGGANQLLKVNAAGDALEYGLIGGTNIASGAVGTDELAAQAVTPAKAVMASEAQAIAGEATDCFMTPERVKQAIDGLSSPGGWVPLETLTISSPVASVDFTTGIDGTYDNYAVLFGGVDLTSNTSIDLYLKQADETWRILQGNGLEVNSAAVTGVNNGKIIDASSDGSSFAISGKLYLPNITGGGVYPRVFSKAISSRSGGSTYALTIKALGTNSVTSAVNGIRIEAATGLMSAGKFTLYGLAGA